MITRRVDGDPPVYFLQGGSGPSLLFLHGFNGGSGLWAPNLEDLARAGFSCVAPDFPGWGDSPPLPDFTYRVPDLCHWLTGFLDRHAPGPVTVIGHSFGGAVALLLALTHPERVRRLVLINSAGLTARTRFHYRLLCLPGVGEWLLRPNPEKTRRELASFAVTDLALIPPAVMGYIDRVVMHPWFTRTSLSWVRRNGVLWRGARALSLRHRLAEVRQPTLLMVGDRDPLIDPADSYTAAQLIPGARLSVFPGGLHLLPLDRREEFCRELVAFTAGGQTARAL